MTFPAEQNRITRDPKRRASREAQGQQDLKPAQVTRNATHAANLIPVGVACLPEGEQNLGPGVQEANSVRGTIPIAPKEKLESPTLQCSACSLTW